MKSLIQTAFAVWALFGGAWSWAEIPAQHTDADVLGVLAVIDDNEITAAELAEQKNLDRVILDYARMVGRDHSVHLSQTRKLSQQSGIRMADTAFLQELRRQGRLEREALLALDGVDFGQLYIADMIKDHSQALDWIDNQTVQNRRISDFLKVTRRTLALHLKRAQQLQEQQTGVQM